MIAMRFKNKSVKDDDITLYNKLIRQFNNIVLSEKLAGIAGKKNLLKGADSKSSTNECRHGIEQTWRQRCS